MISVTCYRWSFASNLFSVNRLYLSLRDALLAEKLKTQDRKNAGDAKTEDNEATSTVNTLFDSD